MSGFQHEGRGSSRGRKINVRGQALKKRNKVDFFLTFVKPRREMCPQCELLTAHSHIKPTAKLLKSTLLRFKESEGKNVGKRDAD